MGVQVNQEQTAEAIFQELHHACHGKGDEAFDKHLEEVKTLLHAMTTPQVERCVSDELSGAIAVLAAVVCAKGSDAALIMVSRTREKPAKAAMLAKAVTALKETGRLNENVELINRKNNMDYFCMKRYHNALMNGNSFPRNTDTLLSLESISRKHANKICVNSNAIACSSCYYRGTCRFRQMTDDLRTGAVQIQVLDIEQYRRLLAIGNLPKSRIVVFTEATRQAINGECSEELTISELVYLANDCESQATEKYRPFVAGRAATVRRLAQQLRDGAPESKERKLLDSTRKAFREIRDKCAVELKKRSRARLNSRLLVTGKKLNRLLAKDAIFEVARECNGKRVVIRHRAAGQNPAASFCAPIPRA